MHPISTAPSAQPKFPLCVPASIETARQGALCAICRAEVSKADYEEGRAWTHEGASHDSVHKACFQWWARSRWEAGFLPSCPVYPDAAVLDITPLFSDEDRAVLARERYREFLKSCGKEGIIGASTAFLSTAAAAGIAAVGVWGVKAVTGDLLQGTEWALGLALGMTVGGLLNQGKHFGCAAATGIGLATGAIAGGLSTGGVAVAAAGVGGLAGFALASKSSVEKMVTAKALAAAVILGAAGAGVEGAATGAMAVAAAAMIRGQPTVDRVASGALDMLVAAGIGVVLASVAERMGSAAKEAAGIGAGALTAEIVGGMGGILATVLLGKVPGSTKAGVIAGMAGAGALRVAGVGGVGPMAAGMAILAAENAMARAGAPKAVQIGALAAAILAEAAALRWEGAALAGAAGGAIAFGALVGGIRDLRTLSEADAEEVVGAVAGLVAGTAIQAGILRTTEAVGMVMPLSTAAGILIGTAGVVAADVINDRALDAIHGFDPMLLRIRPLLRNQTSLLAGACVASAAASSLPWTVATMTLVSGATASVLAYKKVFG